MTHIDDWIEDCNTDVYAAWFFTLHRLPATMQFKFASFISQYRLFCNYKGERYRVTGASRLGDVWLTKNFKRDHGYQLRVAVDDCSGWANAPAVMVETNRGTPDDH